MKGDNWHNLDFKRKNFGYGWIHYAMICNLKPKRVLCIGSRYGFIPAICAMACKDSGGGTVDFVDAGYGENEEDNWGGVGNWKNAKSNYFEVGGIEKNIKLQVMKTSEFARKSKGVKWDYVYIDGDHSYPGVKYDFETFWPRLRLGGMLAIHDIFTTWDDGSEYGTSQFWREIKQKYREYLEIPGDFGLGILKKSYNTGIKVKISNWWNKIS